MPYQMLVGTLMSENALTRAARHDYLQRVDVEVDGRRDRAGVMRGTAGDVPSSGKADEARNAVLSLGIALARAEDGGSPRFGLDLLEKAPYHAEKVAEALGKFQYEPYSAEGSDKAADYGDVVEQAVVDEDVDVLVVHIVGHGVLAEGSSEKLYVLDSNGKRLSRPVGAWIDRIEDHERDEDHQEPRQPVTLFVLDVCYAGEVAVTSWHARMDVAKRRAWVLAATGPRDQAFGYRLSRALVSVLGKYTAEEVRFHPSVRYIPPSTVWQEIERAVNDLTTQDKGLPQTILTSLVPSHADLSHLPFFPNPCFDPAYRAGIAMVAGLPSEIAQLADWASDPSHFMLRAGWYRAGGPRLGRELLLRPRRGTKRPVRLAR